jgi:hypothetical protein
LLIEAQAEREKIDAMKAAAPPPKPPKVEEEEVLLTPETAVEDKERSLKREEASRWRPGPSRGEHVAATPDRDPGWRFEPKFSSGSRRDR